MPVSCMQPGMWGSGRLSAATCWPLAVAGVWARPLRLWDHPQGFTSLDTEPNKEKACPFSLRPPGSLGDSISAGCLCPNVSLFPGTSLSCF